jgi:hypothetical protein
MSDDVQPRSIQVQKLKELLRADPKDFRAWSRLASAQGVISKVAQAGHPNKALPALDGCLLQAPLRPVLHHNRAIHSEHSAQSETASRVHDRPLELADTLHQWLPLDL